MDQHDTVDSANVDAKFETGATNYRTQFTRSKPLLDFQSKLASHRRMMHRYRIGPFRKAAGKQPAEALGRAAHIGENQRRAIALQFRLQSIDQHPPKSAGYRQWLDLEVESALL